MWQPPWSAKQKLQLVAIVVVSALLSGVASRTLWYVPPTMGGKPPFIGFLAMFAVQIIEAIAFGVAVAFAIVAYKPFFQQTKHRTHSIAAYFAIFWLLGSWWAHDNFHAAAGCGHWLSFLEIEWGFHVTDIVAGAIVAFYLLRVLWDTQAIARPE